MMIHSRGQGLAHSRANEGFCPPLSPGAQLQAPLPGSPPAWEAPSVTPGSWQKSGQKRFPGNLLPVYAQGPRSLDSVLLLGQRLSPEDQEDKEVDGKLHMAEDRDAEAAVQEAAQGGPQGAGQRLHRGAEAQHGPCGVRGVMRVRPGWVSSVTTPATHFRNTAEASTACDPPAPLAPSPGLWVCSCGPPNTKGPQYTFSEVGLSLGPAPGSFQAQLTGPALPAQATGEMALTGRGPPEPQW